MKDLCARGRAAMNLLLVLSALQAWNFYADADSGRTVYQDVGKIGAELTYFREIGHEPAPAIQAFLKEAYPEGETSEERDWEPLKLRLVLMISDKDMADARPTPDDIYKHALKEATETARKVQRKSSNEPPDMRDEKWFVDFIAKEDRERVEIRDQKLLTAMDHLRHLAGEVAISVGTSTLSDLEMALDQHVELPIVKQHVDSLKTFWILEFAMFWVLALVAAILDSIWIVERATDERSDEAPDLLLLYRSKIAIGLGVVWLLLPSSFFLLRLAYMYFEIDAEGLDGIYLLRYILAFSKENLGEIILDIFLLSLTAVLAAFSIRRAHQVRRSLRQNTKRRYVAAGQRPAAR
jgi:hypothetical protein